MFIRFKDLYAIAHDPSLSNHSWNKLELLCANINGDQIEYLKPLKYEYYHVSDEPFNCMLYEKEKFKSFNLEITYEQFYKNMIYNFIKKSYKKFQKTIITFVYDNNVIEIYGKELYYNGIIEAINKISEEFDVTFKYSFKNIINVAPGELIAIETRFLNNIYSLTSYEFRPWYVSEKSEYKDLIDERCYNGEKIDYPLKTYIVDRDFEKYSTKPIRCFTLVDINAYSTFYYTYSMNERIVKLENIEKVNVGLMSIIEWIYEQSEKRKDIYYRLKEIFKKLCYIPEIGLTNWTYGIDISMEKFYNESPIVEITDKLCEIKMEIFKKYKFAKKIIYRYNIESLSELKIIHSFLKQQKFNGQPTKLLELYKFLIDAWENELVFGGSMSSEKMVYVKTGKKNFEVNIKLSDYGYEYKYEIDGSAEIF